MFEKNGLKSFHGTKWRVDEHDCFSDTGSIPFVSSNPCGHLRIVHAAGNIKFRKKPYERTNLLNLERLEKKYTNALLILNTRSLKKWLISRFQHGVSTLSSPWRRKAQRGKSNWAYPPSKELAKKWIDDRNNYYSDVLNYFVDKPEKLTIVNVEEPGWIKYICEILKLKNSNIKSRRVSKTTKEIDKIIKIIDLTFKDLGYDDEQQRAILLNDNKKYLDIYKNNMS